jgi:hypothetical protein
MNEQQEFVARLIRRLQGQPQETSRPAPKGASGQRRARGATWRAVLRTLVQMSESRAATVG